MAIATKPQNWGDDLRLPSLTNPADTAPLLPQLEQYRKISLPLQSKHLPALKRNNWFALRRPTDKSRTGLLVIWPERACCLFLAAQGGTHRRDAAAAGNRFALLRLRLDPQLLAPDAGLTVLAATMSSAARRIWVEDLFVWKGRDILATEPFSTRLRLAAQWLEHYCMLDPRLLGGLEMEMAAWQPLGAIQPEGAWEILQADAAGMRRFFWLARRRVETLTPASVPDPAPDTIELVPAPAVPHVIESGPPIAVATRESGPDQWALSSADGVALGRALIRTMSVSSALRTAKTNTMRVEVAWAAGFGKWEIKGIAPAGVVASSSAVFAAASK